jgi:hypothetical protein
VFFSLIKLDATELIEWKDERTFSSSRGPERIDIQPEPGGKDIFYQENSYIQPEPGSVTYSTRGPDIIHISTRGADRIEILYSTRDRKSRYILPGDRREQIYYSRGPERVDIFFHGTKESRYFLPGDQRE